MIDFVYIRKNISFVIAFTLLIIIALSLRLHHLAFDSLFMDEIRQVSYYKNSIIDIISNAASQQQPPLDYWIGHYIFKFSSSDFSARLPAAIFGTASVILLVFLCLECCRWPIALFVGLVMSLMPFHIYFSQDARPYSIAIFFFLAFIYTINHIVKIRSPNAVHYLMLLFVTTLFLYSRTLSPLCVFSITFSLITLSTVREIKNKAAINNYIYKYTKMMGTLFLAFIIYIPIFLKILESGQRYTDKSTVLSMQSVLSKLGDTPFFTLWRVYEAQLEPITYIVLFAVISSFVLVFYDKAKSNNTLIKSILVLLPSVFIFNLVVFHFKTSMPFRPPYALYVLPLTLILFAYFLDRCWCFKTELFTGRYIKPCLISSGVIFIIYMSQSVLDFKTLPKKSDWRGLTKYITTNYNDEQIFLFDSLSTADSWKPIFYGLNRYPLYDKNTFPIKRLINSVSEASQFKHEPILILFHYRDYKLTRNSRYAIIEKHEGTPDADMTALLSNKNVDVKQLTGFSIISLKNRKGHFLVDSFILLKEVLLSLPQNATLVDLYLAAASISAVCDDNEYQQYIHSARNVANKQDIQYIDNYVNIISSHKQQRSVHLNQYCDVGLQNDL
jgi:hypothetical protein